MSTSPVIPPKEWKECIKDITLRYPELINPDNSEENKLWPWFGDLVHKKNEEGENCGEERRHTAFMYKMRATKVEKIKSSCCFKSKRKKRDIYK